MLRFFRFLLLGLARRLYKIRIHGGEHIPDKGGAVIVANHITWIDAFLISTLSERQVRFVIAGQFLKIRTISWFIRMTGAIAIENGRPRDAVRATTDAANAGDLVCFFPEGQLSRSGLITQLRKGIRFVAHQLDDDVPIIPLYIDGMWGSIFSYERQRYFFKWPRRGPDPVSLIVGPPIAQDQATAVSVRHHLQELSVTAFTKRNSLLHPLGDAILKSLKKHPTRPLFIEHTNSGSKPRRKVSRAATIAAAIALAARWRHTLPDDETRVGILLPGGAAAAFLNLGLILAGRVPVNLPFGGDQQALAKKLDQLGIRTAITSRAFAPALQDFPWETSGQFIDLRTEIDAAGSVRMLLERVRACLEPLSMARRRLAKGVAFSGSEDAPNPSDEAYGYVWTDPDSDELHSTFLSHLEVQASVDLLHSCAAVDHRGETIFCEHAHNSAAGSLFALWHPVLGESVCVARSAGARSSEQSIESVVSAESATLMISSPDLNERILGDDEWHPGIASHLHRVFDFSPTSASNAAETLPKLENAIGAPICPGWAPDQMGIAVSLSLPDSSAKKSTQFEQPGRQPFSVGRLLPGIAHRVEAEPEPLAEDCDDQFHPLHLWLPSTGTGGDPLATDRSSRVDGAGFLYFEPESPVSSDSEADE